MTPGSHDFTLYAGATFLEPIAWQDADGELVDFALYHGLMQIRPAPNGALIAELSTANGGIAAQTGGARLFLSDETTRAIAPGNYSYDLLVESKANGVVTPLLRGKVAVRTLITAKQPSDATA